MTKKVYQPLTLPRVTWNTDSLTDRYAEVVAQPLESGFGFTLGNALRRVLLGGVEGSAVVAVIIKGVNNEFATLSGVIEDTMNVVLNIKQIVVRNKTGMPGKMHLLIKGEKIATVGDIKADDHLELVNKEHVLAHVAAQGVLDIEFFVESGRGYRQAQWPDDKALQEDNRIYLDAMFSPVRNVSYDVEKTRVGKDIDYDKLTLMIETDGSESPVAVFHYAVSVLRTQLEFFLAEPEISFNEISALPVEERKEKSQQGVQETAKGIPVDLLLKPIDILEFSVRAHNCLINAGVKRVIDLVNLSEDEAMKIKNFGRKSLDEVKEGMKGFGLLFGMDIDETELKQA